MSLEIRWLPVPSVSDVAARSSEPGPTMAAELQLGALPEPMYPITDPVGRDITIPENSSENSASFSPEQHELARAYFKDNGYVVLRNIIEAQVCDELRSAFASTVKSYPGYIYRQTTSNPEKNVINKYGFVMNPILNLQSLSSAHFHQLKSLAMATFSSQQVKSIGRTLVGEDVKLVQSMYFEGNAETWPHQDTYYLDSERVGTMFACWFALEDINAGAGRFFVVPGSHNIEMDRNGGDVDYAFNHDKYKDRVKQLLLQGALEIRAPFLSKGDVLFWNSKTIHGSLRTTRPEFSRASLTAHYIPASHRFLQFQARIKRLNLRQYNGMQFHCPKDMDKTAPRMVLGVETRFPKTFQAVKRLAIKALVR